MRDVGDDLNAGLALLERLEAERKAAAIPAAILDIAWLTAAQAEAVVDALLVAQTAHDDKAYTRARHTGEWAARIASELANAPQPELMRRCGVLAHLDAAVLHRVPEVRECAPIVAAFQAGCFDVTAACIIDVAQQFDTLICGAPHERYAPADALRMLARSAGNERRPIVTALRRACRKAPPHVFHAA